MNKQALRADFLLLLTSCIWGFGFVAQRSGMEYVGPFTYSGIRFALGSISLLPLILYRKKKLQKSIFITPKDGSGKNSFKTFILSSLAAGTFLFLGVSLQQVGIVYTTAGKAGFITGLYVVLVPVFGLFLGKKTGLPTWVGAFFTLLGLFFVSTTDTVSGINPGDVLIAAGAVFWACHVLVIDRLVKTIDPIILSSAQFAWCSLFSSVTAGLTESVSWGSVFAGIIPILYGGLCSVGIAYTLQAVAQRHAPPAHATIILCLESVFAAVGGVLILSEPLGPRTVAGFALILCGMLATQWDVIAGGFRKKTDGENQAAELQPPRDERAG
ncbi:DMT family transporter [Breznakiella homolactica]|uniref:DMT family transporter n=1 Tax=Breznakiella homolactica TaxID=2798577 RepID=A0A7T8BBK9_9SPIR|nr:DMT family transporter [Breznakiella homolactica]QQO09318.1 DMT family transporter [Breznakiella homolactica]